MVLFLSLAVLSSAAPRVQEEENYYWNYKDVPVERWRGADPEELVRVTKELFRRYNKGPEVDPIAQIIASDLDAFPVSASFDPASSDVTLSPGKAIFACGASFKVGVNRPFRFSLGSEFRGERVPLTGEEDPGPAATAAFAALLDFSNYLNPTKSRIELDRYSGTVRVGARHYPRDCGHPYHSTFGNAMASVRTLEVYSIHFRPLPPVRPGDTPSIDSYQAKVRVVAAWQRHLAWPEVRIHIDAFPTYFHVGGGVNELTAEQAQCARDGTNVLMYMGSIEDMTTYNTKYQVCERACLFQVDAVTGNVMGFLDVTEMIAGMLPLSASPWIAPHPELKRERPVFESGVLRAESKEFVLRRHDLSADTTSGEPPSSGVQVWITGETTVWTGRYDRGSRRLWFSEKGRWARHRPSVKLRKWLDSIEPTGAKFGLKKS